MESDDKIHTDRIIRALGTTATVEALTWAGLLVGMILKRVLEVTEVGVQVFGPLHGVAFIAYSITAALAWRAQGWNTATGSLALLASLPPFGTVIFHRWAGRTGRLDQTGQTGQTGRLGQAGRLDRAGGQSLAPTAQMPVVADPPLAPTGSLPTTPLD